MKRSSIVANLGVCSQTCKPGTLEELKPGMIFLRGRELASMYKPCYMDAQAQSR